MTEVMPFPYYGGKHSLFQWITSYFPPHELYCEPFGGSGVIMVNKQPSKIEIFNDLDDNIYNFFKVLQNKKRGKRFLELIQHSAYCEKIFLESRELLFKKKIKNGVAKALAWYNFINMAFGGINHTGNGISRNWGSNKHPHPTTFQNKITQLPIIKDRIQNWYIINIDALELIKKVNKQDSLLYIDPPYLGTADIDGYNVKFFDESKMIDLCLTNQSMIIISHYEKPAYKIFLDRGWKLYKKNVRTTASNPHDSKRTEVLYINPLCVANNKKQPELFE